MIQRDLRRLDAALHLRPLVSSPSVCEALADAFKRLLGAPLIVHAKRSAQGVAEAELRQLAVQVLLGGVSADTLRTKRVIDRVVAGEDRAACLASRRLRARNGNKYDFLQESNALTHSVRKIHGLLGVLRDSSWEVPSHQTCVPSIRRDKRR